MTNPTPTKTVARAIVAFLIVAVFAVIAAPAHATIVATPMSDPLVPVSQGSQLATLFQNTEAVPVVADLNGGNYGVRLTVTDGSACPLTFIRRGTSRYRCTVPAGGAVLYSTSALAATTFTYAVVNGSVAAGVAYAVTPTPFVATVWVITCFNGRPWASYPMLMGCPAVSS